MTKQLKQCKNFEFKHWKDETLHCEIWDGRCKITNHTCVCSCDVTKCPKYEPIERRMTMRLIDADVLENEILLRVPLTELQFNSIKFVINKAPTIEAKPVVRAHWIVTSNGEDKWVNKCSACGGFLKRGQKQTNFCPNCGAQMPGGSLKNNTPKADVDKHLAKRGIIGEWVKIPVISMEDVPKLMEEMEK